MSTRRVRGPDVDPVLGRKGLEGQEHVPVLGETRGRGWELRGKRGQEEIEGPVGRRLRLRHPDVVEHGFRLGLHARGKLVQHIGRLVDPTALLTGLRKHFPHRAPKAEAAVPDGQLGIDREPAVPDVQQQLAPRLFGASVIKCW